MASAFEIVLSPKASGCIELLHLTQQSADRASQLLMQNHAKYHVLFNEAGLHNHIVHHLLSIYALGATPEELQAAYDLNQLYQLPAINATGMASQLTDPDVFEKCLGKTKYYKAFVSFFQNIIAEKGIKSVVNEFVFKRDERADDMLARMFSGFLHPILHMGFGLEFSQPCIVAESLAQAAVHDNSAGVFLFPAEKATRSNSEETFAEILSTMRADPVVSTAVKPSDPPDKIASGLLRRALNETVSHLARYHVPASKLEQKNAEMMSANVYMIAAAQRPRKKRMFDFFMMHSVNLSIFYTTFLQQSWISTENKCRLLEWKGRMDLVMYAACKTPAFYPDRIQSYVPNWSGSWDSIYSRARTYEDDGHTAKLIRVIKNAEVVSAPFAGSRGFVLQQDSFIKIAHMVMDSVEDIDLLKEPKSVAIMRRYGPIDDEVVRIVKRWVRWCGLEDAWDHVPDTAPESNM